jgi:dCTP deaminase
VILTDTEIQVAIQDKQIVLQPFRAGDLRINSYDVHLGATLLTSKDWDLDAAADNEMVEVAIPEEGLMLAPGRLYLAVTEEYTESHRHVPYLDGKSSIGRLGMFIHATAGRGDVGFCGHWTMELSVVQPLRVYAGMPIGQLTWHTCGVPSESYGDKAGSTYTPDVSRQPKPVPSGLWKKLRKPGG